MAEWGSGNCNSSAVSPNAWENKKLHNPAKCRSPICEGNHANE